MNGYNNNRTNPNYGPQQQGGNNRENDTTTQFVAAIKTCFTKYVEFNGRASRAEFWWWILFIVLINAAFSVSAWAYSLASTALICPTLAVSWRRLHDIGKGGGYWFLIFIPLVGMIILTVWACTPGEYHPNRFGYNPYGYNDGMPPVQPN